MFKRFAPAAFAILRIVAGLMFALHGAQKVLGWPRAEGMPHPLPRLLVAAGAIELVCGVLITIGLFASIAAFVASGEMAVAYFIGHAPHHLIPIVNKGELAVVYCFLWLYVAAAGAGAFSLDARRGHRLL